jgi:hypothetical protein
LSYILITKRSKKMGVFRIYGKYGPLERRV